MDTSGLLVLARTEQAYVELQRQFASRETVKRYEAVLSGVPTQNSKLKTQNSSTQPSGCLEAISLPLIADINDRPRQRVDMEHGKWLPRALLEAVPGYASLPPLEQDRERIKHDFEFWCARCASIQDKVTNRIVPFVPNRPQRRVAAAMEQQRLTRHSVRLIVLKARQWGSSTLAILYMAWMQIVVHRNWNCLICSHQRGSSGNIGRIYSQLLRHYPAEMLDPGVKRLELKTLEGMRGVKELSPRGGIIVTGSASSQDAVRGFNLAMAHLSEVAFWKDSARHDPVDVMRTVEGSVMLGGDTVVILESTANGVGNFFHNEWLRASSRCQPSRSRRPPPPRSCRFRG